MTFQDKGDYIVQAAKQISLAQHCEASNNYQLAFSYYKNGVGILLTGVQCKYTAINYVLEAILLGRIVTQSSIALLPILDRVYRSTVTVTNAHVMKHGFYTYIIFGLSSSFTAMKSCYNKALGFHCVRKFQF